MIESIKVEGDTKMAVPTGITYDNGSTTYTADYSENYKMAFKFAKQAIYNVESANPLQWINKGEINNGVKIEDSIIALQNSYAWDGATQTGASVDAPSYPDIRLRIFEDWNGRQFKTTVSDDQIRKILLEGGDDMTVAEKIVSNLTESEGNEDFQISKGLLASAVTNGNAIKYLDAPSTGVPIGDQLAIAIHDIVDGFQFVNSDYVAAQDVSSTPLQQRTPFDRIHIVIPYKIYNKLNIQYLATLFNMEVAELIGKISKIDEGTNVYVLDEFAVGKYRRLYRLTSRYVEDGLYQNYWLTTERMYYTCGLFKFAYIPVNLNPTPETPPAQ